MIHFKSYRFFQKKNHCSRLYFVSGIRSPKNGNEWDKYIFHFDKFCSTSPFCRLKVEKDNIETAVFLGCKLYCLQSFPDADGNRPAPKTSHKGMIFFAFRYLESCLQSTFSLLILGIPFRFGESLFNVETFEQVLKQEVGPQSTTVAGIKSAKGLAAIYRMNKGVSTSFTLTHTHKYHVLDWKSTLFSVALTAIMPKRALIDFTSSVSYDEYYSEQR